MDEPQLPCINVRVGEVAVVYYYLTPALLRAGSIIEPGNWGRIIRGLYRTGNQQEHFRLHRELAFEYGRTIFNPAAPSRLDCLFLCASIEEARSFARDQLRHLDLLYEVELLDMDAAVHLTSWAWFDGASPDGGYEALDAGVGRYWTETPSMQTEVLTGGAARIVSRVAL